MNYIFLPQHSHAGEKSLQDYIVSELEAGMWAQLYMLLKPVPVITMLHKLYSIRLYAVILNIL